MITVLPERSAAYRKAFELARPLVQCQSGCYGCRLLPKLEAEGEFLLLIEWESKAHHTEGFRKSVEYREWSRLLHPFYAVLPEVQYFNLGAELFTR